MPTTRRTWKSGTTRQTKSGTTHRSGWTSAGSSRMPTSYSPTKYTTSKKELVAKIGSYRTLNQQFTGAGKVTAFSPSGANKWIKYVDQGAWIYKWNNAQFCRYFGTDWKDSTPTAAMRYLKQKFGSNIKAVTRGKGNHWLVAAMPKITARPFYNYNWK